MKELAAIDAGLDRVSEYDILLERPPIKREVEGSNPTPRAISTGMLVGAFMTYLAWKQVQCAK